ncbi:MAG TPA: glycosyltransferase family 39 protein, partial [Chloroflexota bacterium]|nr:glycosyltransferase family 39 protein [Chloroflexota bacterium]
MRTRAARTVLALTLLAWALRLCRIDALGDLEFDEIVSVRYAALPAGELLATLSGALFEHPPLYYLALGAWLALTGAAPATDPGDLLARLLSIFPGALLVPLTFAAGSRSLGARTGTIAAALVALAPLPLFYSREARMYELVACLGLAATWLFARASARGTTTHWLAFALTGAAAALVHYAGLLLVLVQPLTLALDSRRRRSALLALGAVLLPAAAWGLSASGVRGSLPAFEWRNVLAVPAGLWAALRELAGGAESGGARTVITALALCALCALGAWRTGRRALPLLASAGAGVLAVAFAIALGKPVYARYALAGAPFVYLLAAAALSYRAPLARPLAALTLLFGVLPWGATYFSTYRRADYGDITRRIATHERPGDAILLTGPWQAWYFDYYYPRTGGSTLHRVLPRNAPPALDPAQAALELAALQSSHRRVWFVQAGLAQADPSGFVEGWLRQHAWPALREPQQTAVLSLYAFHPPENRRPLRSVDLGGVVRLAGGWVDGDEVPATDVARLSLDLELLSSTDRPLRGSLRLVGADGQRLATDFDLADVDRGDRPIQAWRPGERVSLRRGVWVPVSANPQPYDVRLVVYDGETLAPLVPAGAATGSGGEVSIGSVYVTQTRAQQPPPEGTFERLNRVFGGGDAFDVLHLVGLRWHQRDASAAPLGFDLLWRIEGATGALHRTRLSVRGAAGRAWLDASEPLFSGSFPIDDWRPNETLGERRVLDLTSLPNGDYTISLGLLDERGREVPIAGPNGVPQPGAEVPVARIRVPHRTLPGEWLG